MTAISAASAIGTSSNNDARTVLLPGSPATYGNRAVLRGMGLRWDPAGHRWHGTTTAAAVKTLRERLHLEVRVFGVLERGAPEGPTAPKPASPRPAPLPTTIPSASHDFSPRPHDGSRTHLEPRIALPTLGDEPEEFCTAGRTFSLREITSGFPMTLVRRTGGARRGASVTCADG